jgi:hypothetical protein
MQYMPFDLIGFLSNIHAELRIESLACGTVEPHPPIETVSRQFCDGAVALGVESVGKGADVLAAKPKVAEPLKKPNEWRQKLRQWPSR